MFDIELQTIHSGYDRKTCWVHVRAGAIPANPPVVVLTVQELRLTGSDIFYEINDMRTDDGGTTWVGPTPHKDTLGRCRVEGGIEEGVCDFWPAWHAKSGVLLGTGTTCRYKDDEQQRQPRPRSTAYSVYDAAQRTWSPGKKLATSDPDKFFDEGAGCTQRVDLPNGEILLPTCFGLKETAKSDFVEGYQYAQYVSSVLRCAFDGETLSYIEHGSELTVPEGRGLAEPSLARAGGRYYLTLRNNDTGYVTAGDDGLHFDEPRPWAFDDGSDLGNYNTQQHWVTHGDELYLVYTRRGANNDHVFRHRAPLFIAEIDKDRLYVIRETERILIPERGARLGNSGVTQISEHETWVTVTEWMQTLFPDFTDSRACERYGSNNAVFIARILFQSHKT